MSRNSSGYTDEGVSRNKEAKKKLEPLCKRAKTTTKDRGERAKNESRNEEAKENERNMWKTSSTTDHKCFVTRDGLAI